MRGPAELARQVLVEDGRTAARSESTPTPGRGRSLHHAGQPDPRQRQVRLRGHARGDRLLDRELARQDRRPM